MPRLLVKSYCQKKYLKVIFEHLTDDKADFLNKGFNFILKVLINKLQTRLNYYNIKLCCKYHITMKKALEFKRTQFELQFGSQYSCEIKSNYLFYLGLSFFHLTHRFSWWPREYQNYYKASRESLWPRSMSPKATTRFSDKKWTWKLNTG